MCRFCTSAKLNLAVATEGVVSKVRKRGFCCQFRLQTEYLPRQGWDKHTGREKPPKQDTVTLSQEELQQMLDVATPHQLAEYGRKSPETAGGDVEAAPAHVSIVAPHLLAALACEKYGMDDEALAYIGVVSDLHPKLGGVEAP